MNRRAYVFSTIAILVAIVLIAGIYFGSSRQASRQAALHNHVLATDAYLEQLEQDFSRVLYISGYRSLLVLEDYVSGDEGGVFLTDFEGAFQQVMLNGSVPKDVGGGSVEYIPFSLMENTTLEYFRDKVLNNSRRYGLDIMINLSGVTAEHTSPWMIRVNATLSVNVTTRDPNTSFNYDQVVSREFLIFNLRDPLYAVGTSGDLPNPVVQSTVVAPYVSGVPPAHDVSGLRDLWNWSVYMANTSAPSFLQRFEGDLSASPYGIYSLVDTGELPVGPSGVDHSVVDYRFFGASSGNLYYVRGMPESFVLYHGGSGDSDFELLGIDFATYNNGLVP